MITRITLWVLMCALALVYSTNVFATVTGAVTNTNGSVILAGIVVSKGQPVRNAAVFLVVPVNITLEQSEAERVATSHADGTFSFAYIKSGDTRRQSFPVVFARKEEYALGIKRLTEESLKVGFQIECDDPELVTGFIFNEKSNGIADATVTPLFTVGTKGIHYDDYIYSTIPGLETVCNPDGSFELACLPPGMTVHLMIKAKGYARKRVGPIRTGQSGFPFTLVPEGRITGRVVDAGTGKQVANVLVRALLEPNINFCDPLSVITAHDGGFLITGVEPGMYTVSIAEVPETLAGTVAPLVKNIEVRSGETTDMPDIKLVRGVSATGRLTFRETGEPLSGVRINAYVKGELRRSVYTDNNGEYSVLCIPGAGRVRPYPMNIYDDVGMKPHSREFEASEGDTINGLDFTFEKGIPMIVRVLSPEGDLVPYAQLNGFPIMGEIGEITVYLSTKRESFGLIASRDDLRLRGNNRTTDIRPGTVLEIQTQRYETTTATGHVIDSDGEPIPLASISARSKRKNIRHATWNTLIGGITDGRGEFTIDGLVIGDENAIIVVKKGYKNAEVTLDTLGTHLNDLGDIVLEQAGCWLEGVVMNKRGEPIPGVRVSIWNDIGKNSANTMTDNRGRYRLEGLLPEMKWMQVDKENYRQYHTRDVVTNVTRNIILLEQNRYLEGTVTDNNGHPIVGAEIHPSFYEPIGFKGTTTDERGRYRFDGLSGVTEDIKIFHPDYGECFYYFIPTNGSWEFILKKPNRFLSGMVVSPEGSPLKGASIRNLPYDYPDGPERHRWWGPYGDKRWTTDDKGRFRIDGIMDGVFSVEIYHEVYGNIEIGNIETNRDNAVLVMKDNPEKRSRGKFRVFDPGDEVPVDGVPAPELKTYQWINGGPLSIVDLRGKIVILDFWSKDDPLSWNATRLIQALHTEYSDRGVVVISIHEYTRDIEAVRAVILTNKLSYPVYVDALPLHKGNGGATFDAYGVRWLVEDLLINREGNVRLNINVHQMEQKLLDHIAN